LHPIARRAASAVLLVGLFECAQQPAGIGLKFYSERPRNVSGEGLLVRYVVPGSPAEKVGMRSGDAIVSANTHDVSDQFDLARVDGDAGPGSCVTFQIKRNNQLLQLPCIARGPLAQSTDDTSDAADEAAPFAEIDGAVESPGVYSLSQMSLREAIEASRPHATRVCIMTLGPRRLRKDRQCFPLDRLPEMPKGFLVVRLES
jgi:hypothetical protein